jgi:hypothetical protein
MPQDFHFSTVSHQEVYMTKKPNRILKSSLLITAVCSLVLALIASLPRWYKMQETELFPKARSLSDVLRPVVL